VFWTGKFTLRTNDVPNNVREFLYNKARLIPMASISYASLNMTKKYVMNIPSSLGNGVPGDLSAIWTEMLKGVKELEVIGVTAHGSKDGFAVSQLVLSNRRCDASDWNDPTITNIKIKRFISISCQNARQISTSSIYA